MVNRHKFYTFGRSRYIYSEVTALYYRGKVVENSADFLKDSGQISSRPFTASQSV